MIRHALNDAWPWLALIGGGVLLLATFARDPKANEHDLSDYHEAACTLATGTCYCTGRAGCLAADEDGFASPDEAGLDDDILPPAPAGMNAGSPLYAGMLFDTWHPESPSDTADRFLRELRDEALAGAR